MENQESITRSIRGYGMGNKDRYGTLIFLDSGEVYSRDLTPTHHPNF